METACGLLLAALLQTGTVNVSSRGWGRGGEPPHKQSSQCSPVFRETGHVLGDIYMLPGQIRRYQSCWMWRGSATYCCKWLDTHLVQMHRLKALGPCNEKKLFGFIKECQEVLDCHQRDVSSALSVIRNVPAPAWAPTTWGSGW